MSKTGRRLGRGLESLVSNLRGGLGDTPPAAVERTESAPVADQTATTSRPQGGTLGALGGADRRFEKPETTDSGEREAMLAVDKLTQNPLQPRISIGEDGIRQLSESIRNHGMLQPIAVRRRGAGYQIIAGERRWRAAKAAGLTKVPVIIREASDEQMLELALIENLQREDLNAIDRAKAYQQFCSRFGLSAEQVAARVGEDRSTVANYLRLLDLSDSLQDLVASGKISMGHARCLLSTPDVIERQRLADAIQRHDMSVRALEEVMRRGRELRENPTASAHRAAAQERLRSAHLRDLEQRFERALKTKVTIREGRKKGSGKVVIEYFTLDDFDRLASAIGVALD